jgi:hypothetical protein
MTERRSVVSFHLNLEQLRKQAKDRLRERRAAGEQIKLSDVQFELAREHGFASWPKLCAQLDGGRSAVLAYLAKPAVIPPPRVAGDSRPRPGVFSTLAGPRFTPDLDTVVFLKERHVFGRHLFVLGFEADDVHPWLGHHYVEGLFYAELLSPGQWRAFGTARPAHLEGQPRRRINLGFSASPTFFLANGTADAEIARVRLRSSNGIELEDETEADWLLLCTDQPVEGPYELDLIDSTGAVVATEIREGPRTRRSA